MDPTTQAPEKFINRKVFSLGLAVREEEIVIPVIDKLCEMFNLKKNGYSGLPWQDDDCTEENVKRVTESALQLTGELTEHLKKFRSYIDPYPPLTPEVYNLHFINWQSARSASVRMGFSIRDMIKPRPDMALIENSMMDAVWLLAKCTKVSLKHRRAVPGSYLAHMTILNKTFKLDSVTPPKYDEPDRFRRMLDIATMVNDIPAVPPPRKKHKVDDIDDDDDNE